MARPGLREVGDGLVIALSARKHGVTHADIHHAHDHPVRVLDLDDGLTMLIGATSTALLLEIGSCSRPPGLSFVHAMRARPTFARR